MSLQKAENLGTNTDDNPNSEYCCYCFKEGKFVDSDITMKGMVEKCVEIMHNMQMAEKDPEEKTPNSRKKTIPILTYLKIWK